MNGSLIRVLVLTGMATLVGCSVNSNKTVADATKPVAATASVRDGAFVHITAGPDEPHRVLMALSMATKMSADKDVLVYCDIDAVKAVVQGSTDLQMEPFGSSHQMIANLAAKGVGIYACPGCLKHAGLTADQLLPGVKVADRSAFFGFTQGRILTIDY